MALESSKHTITAIVIQIFLTPISKNYVHLVHLYIRETLSVITACVNIYSHLLCWAQKGIYFVPPHITTYNATTKSKGSDLL